MSQRRKNVICRRTILSWLWILLLLLLQPVFDDGRVFAGTMSLGEVLHQVERDAPALKAAQANVRVFKAGRNILRSKLFGSIDAFAIDSHFDDDRLTRPISPPINMSALTYDNNQIGYGLSAGFPLDLAGHIRYRVSALNHQANAVQEDAADVRLKLLHDAAATYRALVEVTGQKEALQKQAEALAGHVKLATTAIEVGRIAPVEKLRLVAELKIVQGQLAGLDGAEAALRAQLASLMNAPTFADSVPVTEATPERLRTSLDRLTDRPDLKAAQQRKDGTHAGVIAAKVSYLPEFVATGSWQQNQGYNGSGRDYASWQVIIQARLPLWTGGGRRAEIGQAKAQDQATQYQLLALQDKARAEFIASQGKWDAGKIQHEAAMSSLEAAEELANIQSDRFTEGRISATDLVDAEATLERARSEVISSLVRWWLADDAVRRTMGLPPAAFDVTE